MPVIRVDMLEGRSTQQKRELVAELTTAFCRVAGVDPNGVTVCLHEYAPEAWGSGGSLVADRL